MNEYPGDRYPPSLTYGDEPREAPPAAQEGYGDVAPSTSDRLKMEAEAARRMEASNAAKFAALKRLAMDGPEIPTKNLAAQTTGPSQRAFRGLGSDARSKVWDERTDGEKLEVLREQVRMLQRLVQELARGLDAARSTANRHQHGADGRVLIEAYDTLVGQRGNGVYEPYDPLA
jgi:hypothetical protein